ncbi:hypothetical protein ACQKNX_07900 [Lysinibacillus sp. NPDC093712]|uniref:hypothetical protein n=1 Tax=Lysinibacillus sp. NPDC093712 TaxID=3390579 RepID=UPI003CFE87FA
MVKEIIVKVEQEFKVSLDMNKYNSENLKQLSSYWGYDSDFTDEEIIEEAVKDIVHNYLNRGYHDQDLEGFPIDGQQCEIANTHVYIEE